MDGGGWSDESSLVDDNVKVKNIELQLTTKGEWEDVAGTEPVSGAAVPLGEVEFPTLRGLLKKHCFNGQVKPAPSDNLQQDGAMAAITKERDDLKAKLEKCENFYKSNPKEETTDTKTIGAVGVGANFANMLKNAH